MRTITLEEHFISPGFLAGPGKDFTEQLRSRGPRGERMYEQLQDIGDKRIAEMDAAGIDMQVLSLNSPGVEQAEAAEQLSIAVESNDFLAEAVKKYPSRFAAFAALPVAAPDKAAEELDRRVRQQGFKGTLINGHTRGRYLDDKFFSPILERAEALNVPIYLHPTVPPKAVVEASFGGFSPAVTAMLVGGAWGWHIETSVHLIRMMLGGVFDRYPKLQVVIGHLGEGIPFMLPRLNKNLPREVTKLDRPLERLSARERALHIRRLQLSGDVPQPAARGRRRADHVLGRSSVRVDGGGACIPATAPGQRGGPGAHRARQRGEAAGLVMRVRTNGQFLAENAPPP